MDPQVPPVVLDNGAENIRAGFNTDDMPRVNIPNLVGQLNGDCAMIGFKQKVFLFPN
jgi:actin-related protein